MARTAKDFQQRRAEILDGAQRLIYTKGYEQMTIQDLLDMLEISKGAFYHYFDSKQALLEAMIERTQDDAKKVLFPILDEPNLPTLQKLERFFNATANWKTARKEYLMAILRGWYRDENALLRQKQMTAAVQWVAPVLSEIIQQGVREGVMNVPYPQQAGMVTISLMTSMAEAIAMMLLKLEGDPDEARRRQGLQAMEDTVRAYTSSLERTLGTPPGSLTLFEPKILKEWMLPPAQMGEKRVAQADL